MSEGRAILALEDGRVFHGTSFGAEVTASGEACFNTSMTGYQEILTDPSYRGQIVAMTYPLIGNYGVNELDVESAQPHVRGFVIEQLCRQPSSWRATESLDAYLKRWRIPGIEGIDTRALTKHLRTDGAMRSVLTADPSVSPESAVKMARDSPSMAGSDFVKEVTTARSYQWDPDDEQSRPWNVPNKSAPGGGVAALPEANHRVIAYDFGIKYNILRSLRQAGFGVEVVAAGTPAEEVLARDPDGVFLSNGPGDPAALAGIHAEVRKLIGRKPLFAICLGHQILSHALGGKTYKLKFGHRGGNQPVKDLRTGRVAITSQNHGFAVDADCPGDGMEVTHINLNDQTVEGQRHTGYPVLSVQYHPEAAPGPNDAKYFFAEFAQMMGSAES